MPEGTGDKSEPRKCCSGTEAVTVVRRTQGESTCTDLAASQPAAQSRRRMKTRVRADRATPAHPQGNSLVGSVWLRGSGEHGFALLRRSLSTIHQGTGTRKTEPRNEKTTKFDHRTAGSGNNGFIRRVVMTFSKIAGRYYQKDSNEDQRPEVVLQYHSARGGAGRVPTEAARSRTAEGPRGRDEVPTSANLCGS
jgi:hypothetical protein